jgi:hypothetical protein
VRNLAVDKVVGRVFCVRVKIFFNHCEVIVRQQMCIVIVFAITIYFLKNILVLFLVKKDRDFHI